MIKSGIQKKLLLSHSGVALSSLLAIMLLVNIVMTISFGVYIQDQRQEEADTILQELENSYDSVNKWTPATLMDISHQAMLRHFIVKIYDDQGNLLLDTNQMNKSMQNFKSQIGKQASDIKNEINKEIVKDGRKIGTLQLENMDGFYQEQDQHFLRMFNWLLWGALAFVILGVYFFSRYVAKGISRPLIQIKHIAAQMREGDLSQRVPIAGDRTEMDEVGDSLNHLADVLQQQDQLRKNLTADVAHELRTPLATIQSHIEAFQDGVWEASPEKLQVCHHQVVRLVQLINDLEKLTDIENPMIQLKKQKICLNDLLHDVINTIAGQFADKPISLRIHENKILYMLGDYERLVQVFINLLTNAYKYTNEGTIDVMVTEEKSQIVVRMKDSGTGIASDELPFIFERFYRGEKSRNRKTGGAGIGLAVVKAIVEAHGGKVAVQSKPQEGSEFIVHFPKGFTRSL